MKVLAILLGIFCLLISGYPCCIDDDCDSGLVGQTHENENDQHGNESGLCSPFISCGSCFGFVSATDVHIPSFNFQYISISHLFGLAFKSVETEYAERLWQPPQQVIIS